MTSAKLLPITPLLFIAILIISSLAYVVEDMYLPSMPTMAIALKSNPSLIQLTLSVYLFSFGFSHLFYGPISDRVGRRGPILFGLGLTILGSLLCCFTSSIAILITGRFLQGCGVGACTSVGRAITRDLLSGVYLARLGSLTGMVMVFVTASAPTLGGYIQYYFSWRANFFVLSIITIVSWIYIWKILPETHRYFNPDATKIENVVKNYLTLLSNKTFMGYTFCMSFAYAGILAYVTAAPFLLQTIVGLTPIQFGWMAFIVGGAIFISAFINSLIVIKKGIPSMMNIGIIMMLTSSIFMLVCGLLGWINTMIIMFPITLFSMGAGFIVSNASAGAFQPFAKMAGAAGALFGCIQILTASLTSAIIAGLHTTNQIPLSIILLVISILAVFSLRFLAFAETSEPS